MCIKLDLTINKENEDKSKNLAFQFKSVSREHPITAYKVVARASKYESLYSPAFVTQNIENGLRVIYSPQDDGYIVNGDDIGLSICDDFSNNQKFATLDKGVYHFFKNLENLKDSVVAPFAHLVILECQLSGFVFESEVNNQYAATEFKIVGEVHYARNYLKYCQLLKKQNFSSKVKVGEIIKFETDTEEGLGKIVGLKADPYYNPYKELENFEFKNIVYVIENIKGNLIMLCECENDIIKLNVQPDVVFPEIGKFDPFTGEMK